MPKQSNEIHLKSWHDKFIALANSAKEIKIISPFINQIAVRALRHRGRNCNIKLITKYDIGNFAKGVSDLKTVKKLLHRGVQIRGIKGLHSKVYVFDKAAAVVTSSNFTSGGLVNNFECGIITKSELDILQLTNYFDILWNYGDRNLTTGKIKEWEIQIKKNKPKQPSPKEPFTDEGAVVPKETQGNLALSADTSTTGAYIKFWGKSEDRADRSEIVKEILKWTEAHYAGTFPKGRRPRSIKENETIYMAYLVEKPSGYLIFGKAYATPYVSKRDDASPQERERKEWKNRYPHYIRVHAPIFIDAKLSDCPELEPLIQKHGTDVFQSTQRRANNGVKNIHPHNSLRQQPGMYLSQKATADLEKQFSKAITQFGRVSDKYIDNLPKPTPWAQTDK